MVPMKTDIHPAESNLNKGYKFNFTSVPEVGLVVNYYGHALTLIDIRQYTKKDGSQGNILVWRRSDGVVGSSGLRSKSLSYSDWASEYE